MWKALLEWRVGQESIYADFVCVYWACTQALCVITHIHCCFPVRSGSEMADQATDRLGSLPKSLRLVEAINLYKHEASRPKGWLLAVVEAVYKEGGCRFDFVVCF